MSYIFPRLKPSIEFCTIENKIYFFNGSNSAIELEDLNGFISTVCHLMDGKKNVEEITKILSINFPNEIPYINNLLAAFDEGNLLEDTAYNIPEEGLTYHDITRWSRNIEFFSTHSKAKENKYSYQNKIKSAKIALLGLGGVGSHVLYDLAALGVMNIRGVDFDRVELSNLNRQIIYSESDIGHLKTEAAKKRILQFLPQANIEFFNNKISSPEDIEKVIANCDLAICVLDQPRNKIIDWINIACLKCNVPFICGAFDSQGAVYYTVIPGESGCIECWKSKAKESTLLFQDMLNTKSFVASKSLNVAISPLVSVLGGLILTECLKIITGIGELQSLGKVCGFDFNTAQTSIRETWEKNPLCSCC